jgi:hypothetical protein
MNRLLRICGDYAKDWKLEFSINKCNWTCFGKEVFRGLYYYLEEFYKNNTPGVDSFFKYYFGHSQPKILNVHERS